MVDRYIDMHDRDQDGGLNFEEFMNAVGEGDVHYLMNVSLFWGRGDRGVVTYERGGGGCSYED